MSDDLVICGRKAMIIPPAARDARTKFQKKPYAKVIVEGVNHRGNANKEPKPIRFRSIKRAENHIRTMGLAKD